jgi:asparagine synthase (glutamine-hydrolysing)
MCGLTGFLTQRPTHPSSWEESARRMGATLHHRGPDDAGVWVDSTAGIALAHRRLSILDLSPEGHQPMHSASGRYVIAFNGEIYNHLDIRREIELLDESPRWRGHSDTEVMLAAFEHWGIEGALTRFVGMFALALWDRQERLLYLARDRLGEKPLYYGWMNGVFLFGSELKALRAHPSWGGEINRDALTLHLRHNYIAAPHTIYRGIYKLWPGTVLRLGAEGSGACPWSTGNPPCPTFKNGALSYAAYWSAREAAEQGRAAPFVGTEAEAAEELDRLLRQSVARQMVADVPLGAFLSGGIDSSTVVALMQAQSDRPVKTFTIGFSEPAYNEAEHAHAVARHLGTEHTEFYVSPEQAMAVIPKLPEIFDEPFSDSSQIPTFLVSQLAQQHVTVSLSGDGGDELFGGYNRYFWAVKLWSKIGWAPPAVRTALARAMTALPPQSWNRLWSTLENWLPENWRFTNPGDKLHKLAEIFGARDAERIYWELVSHWKDPTAIVCGAQEPDTHLTDSARWARLAAFEDRMMYLDTMTYLPDDILVKVDRAAMAVSLETRIPFLDHQVVEFAWKLPLSMKIRDGKGKWILRQVLQKYLPRRLIERPKMGFGVPIDTWLRGPLRDWAEDHLNEHRLHREGYFDPRPIREKWADHLSGRRNWAYYLWDVLMFQAWLETQ